MNRFKKSIAILMVSLIFAFTLTGCTKDAENSKEPEKTPKEKKSVRVMSWWNFSDSQSLQQLKSKFEEQNQDYELVFDQIPTKYADKIMAIIGGGGDQVPDVMMLAMDKIPIFAKAGAIQSLDGMMSDDYKNSLYPVVFDAVKFDGKAYAAPRDITSFVMFCNKKMFDEANVPYPNEDWTWDEFLETAKKLTKYEGDKAVQWGYYFSKHDDSIYTWLIQNGASYTDADRKESVLSSPEAKEALQFLQDLTYKHKVCPTETEAKQFGTDVTSPFIANKAAMTIGGLSMSVAYDKENIEYVMVPLPKGKKQATTAFVNSWAIPKGAKDPEASWKVIEFFSSKEGQQIALDTGMGLPASKDVDTTEFIGKRPDNKYLVDALSYSIPFQSLANGAEYYDLVKKNLEFVWLNEKSVEEVTKEIDLKAKDILNK